MFKKRTINFDNIIAAKNEYLECNIKGDNFLLIVTEELELGGMHWHAAKCEAEQYCNSYKADFLAKFPYGCRYNERFANIDLSTLKI